MGTEDPEHALGHTPGPVVFGRSAYSVGCAYQQFVAENRTGRQIGKQQTDQRQHNGGLEALRMERQVGKDPPAQKVIDAFHRQGA